MPQHGSPGPAGQSEPAVNSIIHDGIHRLGDAGRVLAASAVGLGNSVAEDIRLAEMLIAARAAPDGSMLADPAITLKKLLRT